MNQNEQEQWQNYLKKYYKDEYVEVVHKTKSVCIACEENPILWFALNEEQEIKYVVDTHNANVFCGVYD